MPKAFRLNSEIELAALQKSIKGRKRSQAAVAHPESPPAALEQPRKAAKQKKYRNKPEGGYASQKEARRASELRLLERAGEIRNLHEQVTWELIPKQVGERACTYVSDFEYEEKVASGWVSVTEDTKGVRTEVYKIKRKMLLWFHGIRIRET